MARRLQQSPRQGKPKRVARGFLPAARPVEAMLGRAAAQRGFAERKLLTAWDAVVGADLARLCRPARIVWGRRDSPAGAAIVVECAGAAGPEVEHQASFLIERVNVALGWRAVSRVRVVQGAGASFAAPPRPHPPEKPTETPLDRRIQSHISQAEDPGLREKLTRLAHNHAARRAETGKERT